MIRLRLLAVLANAIVCARAQDERRIVSPDGRVEVRVFVAQSPQGGPSRLACEVKAGVKNVVETSFLGLGVVKQEPILGENLGLIALRDASGPGYRGLIDDELTEVRGDVRVSEIPVAGFPAMRFRDGVVHLADAYTGRTPLVCPWRIITLR